MKKLLFTYLKPYRLRISAIFVIVLLQCIGNLYLPTLNADIINNGFVNGDTGYIVRTGAIMLAMAIGIAICSITSAFNVANTAIGV